MKVIKVMANVSTRYIGSRCEDEIEVYVDDNATDEEIEKAKEAAVREWMFEQINWGWTDIGEDKQ